MNNHCIALAKDEMRKQKIVHEEEMKIFSLVSEFNVFYEVNLRFFIFI